MKIKQDEYEHYKETLEENMYFNDKGMDFDGTITVPISWLTRILNWSGSCTDSSETDDYYKNPRAMYVALDLIYRLVDSIDMTVKSKEQRTPK